MNLVLLKSLLVFCTTKNLFKYLRRRYNNEQLKELNNVVKIRGKIRTAKLSIEFLESCKTQHVVPSFLARRLEKTKVRRNSSLEFAFISDEIDKNLSKLNLFRKIYLNLWSRVKKFLAYFDWIRFSRYLANIELMKQNQIRAKHFKTINWLRKQRFGSCTSPSGKTIYNLSNYKLSKAETFVLLHGLEFCLPPKNVKREEIFAEFEVLLGQLTHHTPKNREELGSLKARLNDLAHSFCGAKIDSTKFIFDSDCIAAIKSLRSNKDILITKPDKGSGVVILNKSDYVSKMKNILCDTSKFTQLGPVDEFDNTAKLEAKLQRRLLKLLNQNLLPRTVYDVIRPSGSQRPRMYGLPKTHKENIPCRPILSMTGSAQHQLAKFLSALLQPVLEMYSGNCILDSFSFAKMMQDLEVDNSDNLMCSFDIRSLFTNVPLNETIKICAEALYDKNLPTPIIPKHVFVELMEIATTSVEFSFNNVMYKQIDGVAMGSPLGPALANIFVGFYESKLFSEISKPFIYCRYVDDTFALFKKVSDFDNFLSNLNSLHPALQFTFEKETNNSLPFLDVLVSKSDSQFITAVYRKPTFTGQYIHWNSFGPQKRKTNLINTLVHRALKICSDSTLTNEIDFIRLVLIDNGYPEFIINSEISKQILRFRQIPKEGPQKCPVYLKLPWIGESALNFEKKIKQAVHDCFGSVQTRVIFSTRRLWPAAEKDFLPAHQKSNVVYEYVCRCDSRYVGRTSQRLEDRINQHVPTFIRNHTQHERKQPQRKSKTTNRDAVCDSAIGTHLLNNKTCADHYSNNQFFILSQARSDFHLAALESIFITTRKPNLCRQKEFVYKHKLFL